MSINIKEMNPNRKRNLPQFKQLNNKVPCKANVNVRWIERITTSCIPSMNFTYDITFPNYKALRFELMPKLVPYVEDSNECLECFMIQSVLPFYSNVLYPGDILLKINGQKCISSKRSSNDNSDISDQHNYDKSYFRYLKIFGSIGSDSEITLRFLRSGGKTLNFMLTPSEITLFQSDKHVIAKFIVTSCNSSTATTNATIVSSISNDNLLLSSINPNNNYSNNNNNDSCDNNEFRFPKLEAIYLTFMEQQLPFSVSQMIQGKSSLINWSSIYSFPHSAPAAISLASSSNILSIAPSYGITTTTATSTIGSMDNSNTITVIHPHTSLYHHPPSHSNHYHFPTSLEDTATVVSLLRSNRIGVDAEDEDCSLAIDIINMKKGMLLTDDLLHRSTHNNSSNSDKAGAITNNNAGGGGGIYRDYQSVGACSTSNSSSTIHPTCNWIACSNNSNSSSYPYIIGKYDNENLATRITQQVLANNQIVKSSFDNLSVMTNVVDSSSDMIPARVLVGISATAV